MIGRGRGETTAADLVQFKLLFCQIMDNGNRLVTLKILKSTRVHFLCRLQKFIPSAGGIILFKVNTQREAAVSFIIASSFLYFNVYQEEVVPPEESSASPLVCQWVLL